VTAAPSTRLPAGRHGLPREFIKRNQRERVLTAVVDVVAERGYEATTVADVIKAARISRRTFYEHFRDKEDCFLAAYEMVSDHLVESMTAAAGSFEDWPQQMRAALATMLELFATEPEVARVCMIESLAAGGRVVARHRETMQRFAELLRTGRPRPTGERPPPPMTEEALVGGIVSLIVREIANGRTAQLEQLLDELAELLELPYRDV
jgi:AcrR family transcriptional regulator